MTDENIGKRKGDKLSAFEYDRIFETEDWQDRLPFLHFKKDWKVQIIPPFLAAVIRFKIRKDTMPKDERVSVYFDGYSNLGFCGGKPYWEIYPAADSDTARFLLGEEDEMIQAIEDSLHKMEV